MGDISMNKEQLLVELEILSARLTELENAEEELARQKLLAELGKLAGGISHELRNPLASIANSVYFLKMELEDSNQDVQDSLAIIEKECQAATRIIKDLLDFARSPSCHAQPISIRPLVLDVLGDQEMQQNILIEVDIPIDMPSIFVDAQQMSIVLTNFISNAYEAMPEGGKLTIKAELDHQEGDWVWLSVSDTGTGIKPEDRQKIFEPLFTTKRKGIGLGLPICKMMVDVNGGEIKVDSKVGEGTIFSLKLPIGEE
jgi:signal transduction histidine kinase